MNFKSVCLIFAIALSIAGCASNSVRLDRAEAQSIKAVRVNETVQMPRNGMFYRDQSIGMGGFIGGVIGAVAVAAFDPSSVNVAKAMAANNIIVDRMLRDQFVTALKKSNLFTISSDEKFDAEFRLTIKRYGLTFIPWKRDLQPIVEVKAELVRPDGKIIWSQDRPMSNHSDPQIPARLFDAYMSDIELLREGYKIACDVVVGDLVAKLSNP